MDRHYGVRWAWRDDITFDSWGYTEAGARHIAAVAHGKGWDPQAVAVLSRPHETSITVEHELTEHRPDRHRERQAGVSADDQPQRPGKKRMPMHPRVAKPTKKNPITGTVSVRVHHRP